MRSYAQILPQFWTGHTGKEIRKAGAEAQVLALYLMTCPSSNMIGLYYLASPVLCHETGLTPEGASKGLLRLKELNFAYYEPSEELIWVPEMAKYQLGEDLKVKDRRHKHVTQEAAKYSKSVFYQAFIEKYGKCYHLSQCIKPHTKNDGTTPSKGLVRGMQDHREEQEQEQEHIYRGLPQESTPLTGTPEERETSRSAFDRWSCQGRGHGIDLSANEHVKIHALMKDLEQGPPILRVDGSVPAYRFVPQAVEYCIRERKEFKGISYACKIVKNRIEEWIKTGVPGADGHARDRPMIDPRAAKTLEKTVVRDV